MDPILLFMIFTIVALFLSVPLVFLLTRKESQSSIPSSMFPPGNTGWPIIGETLEFLNARSIPEKFIKDRMRKFSSQIFRTSLFGETFAVVCGPAGNKFLFSNENKLVTVWWPISVHRMFPFSVKSACNEESIKQRKMLPGFLKPEALHKYVGIMDAIAKRHLKENWDSQREITVFPLSKTYTFTLTCKIFMSMEDPMQLAKFADHFSVLVSGMISLPINFPETRFNKAIKASNSIRKLLREIVKQRKIDLTEGKASPTQDILSHMLLASDDSGQFMEEYDIADKISGLLIGGHETTISVITLIVKYLAELPQVYAGVQKEQMEILKSKAPGAPLSWEDIQNMRYSWNVACEVIRLAPPVQGTFREALTDFNYNGFLIPKRWKLHWNTNTTHRNPAYFPEPEKFDPSRFAGDGPASYTYVPFGGGPRMCPGQEFARLEILVFMHNVVTKFRWETILKDEKIVMDPSPRPAKGLPVLLIPHAH